MIRANAVMVAKVFQAQCEIKGCPWTGELYDSYHDANDERQGHLDWHREQETGVPS